MSGDAKKSGRFSNLDLVRRPEAATSAATVAPPAPPAPTTDRTTDGDKPEPFSSHLKPGTKRRLKQAAAKEERKVLETLEQAVTEYLSKYHPNIQD
jgi:hypothetical protein